LVEVLFLDSHRHPDNISTASLAAAKRLGTRAAAKDVLKGKQDRSKFLLAVLLASSYMAMLGAVLMIVHRYSGLTWLGALRLTFSQV
jgi:hypothetical protein